MGITLISNLEPKNAGDFHLLEDIYTKGGHRIADNIAGRNAIPTQRRKDGMKVAVKNNGTGNYGEYVLVLGTVDSDLSNNGNWVEYKTIMGLGDTTSKVYNIIKPTENLIIRPSQEYSLELNFYNKGTLTISDDGPDDFGVGIPVSTEGIFMCKGTLYNEGTIINYGILIV